MTLAAQQGAAAGHAVVHSCSFLLTVGSIAQQQMSGQTLRQPSCVHAGSCSSSSHRCLQSTCRHAEQLALAVVRMTRCRHWLPWRRMLGVTRQSSARR